MKYYCSVSDKAIKLKSKIKRFKSLTHKDYVKFIRINHTIQNPNLFDVDKLYNDYIINHVRKFDLYLVVADFKREFDKDLNAHITTDFTLKI